MIARIGYFENFDFADRDYVVETVRQQPGFQGIFHLVHDESGRAMSVSFFEDDAAATAAQRAVGEAREAGGHGGPSPERVELWSVVRSAVPDRPPKVT